MKTNNRLSKDNNSSDVKLRPMVKETITEHKYMNCETKEICWFDLSTGPKWFETTHYPVNDETRTREVERPMYDTEYIEYLEEQVSDTFGKLVSVEELSKQTISTLEKENQELKNQFLKVVESVLENNWKDYIYGMLSKDRLIQEITKELDKGKKCIKNTK